MKKLHTSQIVLIILSLISVIAFLIYFTVTSSSVPTSGDTSSVPSSQVSPDQSSEPEKKPSIEPDEPTLDDNVKPQAFTEKDKAEIDAVVKKYGENLSVYFEDINSGNTYTYNDEYKYFIASIIKAPYCMYIYQLASDGKCSLDEKFKFEERHKQEGTGKLKDMETPMELTLRELIGYAIKNSDNTAMKIMLNKYTYKGYTEYAKSLGLNYIDDVKYVVNGDITAKDAGIYIKAIYDFIETNEYGPELKKDMLSTSNTMIASKYEIARKYGWADKSFHDMAIVYAPNPYVLTILSDKDEGKQEDYKMFREITAILEKLQFQKYEEATANQ